MYISKSNYRQAIKLEEAIYKQQEASKPKQPKIEPIYRDMQNLVDRVKHGVKY